MPPVFAENNTMRDSIEALKQQVQFGVSPAMATPLMPDGYTVNTAVIPQLVDFLLARGVSGLFVAGTTGEGILLDVTERQRLADSTAAAINGRVPFILHIGANRTDETVTLAKHAAAAGATAIAAVAPYFYGMDDSSLMAYYAAIAAAAPQTPLLLYDIPHMAINGISPTLLARAAAEIPSVAGVKTSRGDAQMIRQLIDAAPEHLIILVGNERIALGTMALGAHGVISGLSTAVPEPFVALTQAIRQGDMTEARRQQLLVNQLIDLLPAGARIGAIKAILSARGVPVGTAVPPRPMPASPVWPAMAALLEKA